MGLEVLAKLDAEMSALMDKSESKENKEEMRKKVIQCNQFLLNSTTFKEYTEAEKELAILKRVLRAVYQDYIILPTMPSRRYAKLKIS
jgi:hypothetical protein